MVGIGSAEADRRVVGVEKNVDLRTRGPLRLVPGVPRDDLAFTSILVVPGHSSGNGTGHACLDAAFSQVVSQVRRARGHPSIVALWLDPS